VYISPQLVSLFSEVYYSTFHSDYLCIDTVDYPIGRESALVKPSEADFKGSLGPSLTCIQVCIHIDAGTSLCTHMQCIVNTTSNSSHSH